MRTTQRHLASDTIKNASRLLCRSILAGWLTFAPSLVQLAAESKKQPPGQEEKTSASSKKARPKVSSESGTDDAKKGAGTKSKAKTASPAAKSKIETKGVKPDAEHPPSAGVTPGVAIAPDELVEFGAQPAAVKKLIESSVDLARQNLAYTFGSSDPANGGLDCSGFIYAVLRQHGFTQVPRDSSGQYTWVRRTRGFRAVISRKPESFELDELLPGDLLFWTGTYATPSDPPISHVMLYLGTEKSTGAKVMIGASDGRTYRGQKRDGVSVFDFLLPRAQTAGAQRATFIGYGRIPGLRE